MSFRDGTDDDVLPGLRRSVARSMALAYKSEPRLLVISFALVAGAWIPDGLAALWLKTLVDGAGRGDRNQVAWSAGGLAAAAALGWLLHTLGSRVEMRFRDRATIEIEAHVAWLQGSVAGIEHHERPEYLDRLALLRDQVFLLNHIYAAVMDFVGSVGRIAITVALMASVHPALIVLAAFAVPNVLIASRRASVERAATEAAGPHFRSARHLFALGTDAGAAKELRVGRVQPELVRLRHEAYDRWYAETARPRLVTAVWCSLGWVLFGSAYAASVVWVASGLDRPAGDVLLVLAAGAGLSRFVGTTMGQTEFLRWTIDAAQRLVWLEDFAAAHQPPAYAEVPPRLAAGIRFEDVAFAYPGTDRLVLEDIDLELPAGSVVALVGENGAGKTTLVKLLCGLYRPTAGRITVDGTDLDQLEPVAWRRRLAGAFQDFFRFEYVAQRTVGAGDLPRLDDRDAATVAVQRAGAEDVLERLPAGLDTQLGPTWNGGVEVSIGQWQKLALARGLHRDDPLVVILDEPTASLDAETEHALFERFAAAARNEDTGGRVTVLVSHRFSTVRMADLIVVLDGSRVTEVGTHAALMAKGGTYAELFEIQAVAYR
jgi:ATP-binding cassette subfamily B protein